jgi:Translation initiation factor 1 (IF-1)
MAKKNQGGKKKHRGKKQQNDRTKKLDILKDDTTQYGKVLERKGGPHMSIRLLTGETVLGIVRGKMRRRVWMGRNDIVLVGIRDFQSDKVDIIHKYPEEHVRQLVEMDEIPDYFTIGECISNGVTGDNIFGEKTEFDNIEEWENKYNKTKEAWELYLAQGNTKKATDMKQKMEKLMDNKPKPKIPNKMTEEEFDAL